MCKKVYLLWVLILDCYTHRHWRLASFDLLKPGEPYKQGDHLSGKPGNVREFGTCQGNVRDVVNSQGIVREMPGNFRASGEWSPCTKELLSVGYI